MTLGHIEYDSRLECFDCLSHSFFIGWNSGLDAKITRTMVFTNLIIGLAVWAAQVGNQLTKMQLSQAAEYRADDLGFKFMSAAGYNPKAGLEVMRKLGKLSGKSKSRLSGVFSTHPPTEARIARLSKILGKPAAN